MIAPAFFDDGYDGSWLDTLLFPHGITILDDAPTQLTETDRAAQSLGTVPRREVALPPFPLAHPARVFDSHHDQPDSPEAK